MNPKLAEAFEVLAACLRLNGRRAQRAYEMTRARFIEIPWGSPMQFAPMEKRIFRRRSAKGRGVKFRPVYGYQGVKDV